MPLIDDNDIQVHLPIDKIKLEDVPDSMTDIILDVERLIKGELSGTFAPATLAAWTTPDDTPEYIRAIGGRLGAAFLYALRLAGALPDLAEYFQFKYDEALAMLNKVVLGTVTLPEVTETVDTGAHLTEDNFVVSGDPVFRMNSEF